MEPVSSRTHPTFIHSLFVSPTDILSAQSVGNQILSCELVIVTIQCILVM